LSFGSPPAMGVTAGTHSQAVVTIRDDDDPQVVVSFSQSEYTVDEGATTTITVTLDKDPERTVEIRLEKTEVDGVSSADYSPSHRELQPVCVHRVGGFDRDSDGDPGR
jgi:hypothetical protein